jgi:hypothetical protein
MPTRADPRSALGWAPLLTLLALAACGDNPCPRGWRRSASEDRCVEAVADGGSDQVVPPPAEAGLAPLGDAGDPTRDANPPFAPDADAGPVDSGEPHASDASEAGIEDLCSDDDLASWQAFQLGGAAVVTTASCVDGSPACPGPACDLHTCLADRAGVSSCRACVAEQVACTASACFDACSPGRGDDECRGCACAAGCMAAFERCAGQVLDVCADCSAGTCTSQSLDVALIMVVLGWP